MNVRSISGHLGGLGLRQNRDKGFLFKHCFVCLGPLCIMGRNRDYNTVTYGDRRAILRHLINFYQQTNVACNIERKVMFTSPLKQLPLSFCHMPYRCRFMKGRTWWVLYFFVYEKQKTPHQPSGRNSNAKDTEEHSSIYANLSDNGCPKFVANL